MTNEEMLGVADIVERATNRFNAQAALHRERFDEHVKLIASMKADHEAKMVEHRAAFGARTEADAKIIAGLRADIDSLKREELATNETIKPLVDRVVTERNGLLTQVQDMRAEMLRLSAQLDWERAEIKRLQWENVTMHKDAEDGYAAAIKVLGDPVALSKERDALRAEVAALQERLRSSIARGDFAQMEVAALKSQNPKQHPVKVGEWVRRLVPSPACDVGTVAKVVHVDDDTSEIEYDVERIDGQHGVWFAKNCEPCDPPIVKREPTIGDTVRLVKIPIMGAVSPELQRVLEWPWIERWGTLNQTALVVEPAYQLEGALSVCLRTNVHVRWPVCCIEVVSEATHDTDAGKAAAESAVRTEPVAEEIKVGDVVEVVSNTGRNTWLTDVGSVGTVTSIETLEDSLSVRLKAVPDKKNVCGGYVSICDVRKVTT